LEDGHLKDKEGSCRMAEFVISSVEPSGWLVSLWCWPLISI